MAEQKFIVRDPYCATAGGDIVARNFKSAASAQKWLDEKMEADPDGYTGCFVESEAEAEACKIHAWIGLGANKRPYCPEPHPPGTCRLCFGKGWFLSPGHNGSWTQMACDKCRPSDKR